MKNKTELKFILKNTKRYFPLILVRTLLSSMTALLLFSFSVVSGHVLDIATKSAEGNINTYIAVLFSAILLYLICYGGGTHLATRIEVKVKNRLQRKLFRDYCNKRYDFDNDRHTGDVLNRFTEDINSVTHGVTSIVPSLVSFVVRISVGFFALIYMSPSLALVFILCGIIFPAVGRLISKRYKYLHKKTLESGGVVRSLLQESFANIPVIKSFSAESVMEDKLRGAQKEFYKFSVKRSLLNVFTHIGLLSFFTVGYYLALVWGAGQIAAGVMTYGSLLATLQIMNHLRQPLQGISGILPAYYSMIASAERLCELNSTETEPEALSGEALCSAKERFSSIEADSLSFSYSDREVFDNISFKIKRGEIVALTGRSGVGKTTLFRLLLGLLETDGGSLTINGDEKITPAHRSLFALVPQGSMILSGTIRENIAFADSSADDERIEEAARKAGVTEFTDSLPDGLDTHLSERGAGLSEGQIQRIAIARALLLDAPILLLDESSSALDENTEKELLSRLCELEDKTILFITHRESVLSVCDKQINFE